MRTAFLWLPVAACCAGCVASTQRVDTQQDAEVTVSYDFHDIDQAVAELSQSLLQSARLGGTEATPKVVTIGRVTNDTCQHLEMDLITQRLGEALMATGRFELTSAVADKASNQDAMVATARTLRGNAEFSQTTVPGQGQLKAPELSLTGKLTQRNVRRDNGGLRVEYFLLLQATRLSDGVVVWQKTIQTVKAVADGMPVW